MHPEQQFGDDWDALRDSQPLKPALPFDYLTESARTASGHFHGHLVALSEIEDAFKDFIAATAKMDRIKKLLFYGEDAAKGRVSNRNFHYYNERTAEASRQILAAEFDTTEQPIPEQNGHRAAEYLLHATLGTATEAGEMIEHLYDVIFEGKPLDLINMREEVFDGQWYHAMFCRVAGITFDQGQRENIAKLCKRFPDKFTTEAANVRDLGAERAVLEGGALTEAQKADILFGAVGDAAQYATRFDPVDAECAVLKGHTLAGNPFGTRLSEPKLVERPAPSHSFYQTGDADAPEQIKDRNGEVVLLCCRICGQAESEITQFCPGPKAGGQ